MSGVGTSRGTARQPALDDQNELVMAGLDPAIHDFPASAVPRTSMPGTSPGMTKN